MLVNPQSHTCSFCRPIFPGCLKGNCQAVGSWDGSDSWTQEGWRLRAESDRREPAGDVRPGLEPSQRQAETDGASICLRICLYFRLLVFKGQLSLQEVFIFCFSGGLSKWKMGNRGRDDCPKLVQQRSRCYRVRFFCFL